MKQTLHSIEAVKQAMHKSADLQASEIAILKAKMLSLKKSHYAQVDGSREEKILQKK